MKLEIYYFATFRDWTGKESETIDSDVTTALELYKELKVQYDFQYCSSLLKVAINDEFSDWQETLKEGDTVAFIPPVSGG